MMLRLFASLAIGLLFASMAVSQCVVAHRGDSAHVPENTLSAVISAAGPADMVEMDVRRAADGTLVLMHNRRVNKTTNGRGRVSRMNWSELQGLDAGSWFDSGFAGEPIPQMQSAIYAAVQGGAMPMIERKSGRPMQYHRAFEQMGLEPNQFRVISFSRWFVRRMNRLNPDYQLGFLGWGRITNSKMRRLKRMGADFVSWNHKRVHSSADVAKAHHHGLDLYVYTVNDPVRVGQLSRMSVDGITTDDPHLVRGVVGSAGVEQSVAYPSYVVNETLPADVVYPIDAPTEYATWPVSTSQTVYAEPIYAEPIYAEPVAAMPVESLNYGNVQSAGCVQSNGRTCGQASCSNQSARSVRRRRTRRRR